MILGRLEIDAPISPYFLCKKHARRFWGEKAWFLALDWIYPLVNVYKKLWKD
jgi:hypothetical protein